MQRGDLSNAIVPRWYFTLDLLTQGHPVPAKRLWRTWDDIAAETPIERDVIAAIWILWQRTHVVCELVVFGQPEAFCEALMRRFDREGSPLRYITPYISRPLLLDALTFMPDVQSVVDLPEYAGQWGGRGMRMDEVSRVG